MKTKNQIGADFQTPVDIAKYMASLIPAGCVTILEPTPGEGNIVNEMLEYSVTAPFDFFLLDPDISFDAIVMNPPFSAKYSFLENAKEDFTKHGMRLGYYILTECMKRSDNIIALMPWFTLSDSDVRMRFLKAYGLVSITPLPRKTFQYARIQTVIILLKKGYKGETTFNTMFF